MNGTELCATTAYRVIAQRAMHAHTLAIARTKPTTMSTDP